MLIGGDGGFTGGLLGRFNVGTTVVHAFRLVSEIEKPSGSMSTSLQPVTAHSRATLLVLGGICEGRTQHQRKRPSQRGKGGGGCTPDALPRDERDTQHAPRGWGHPQAGILARFKGLMGVEQLPLGEGLRRPVRQRPHLLHEDPHRRGVPRRPVAGGGHLPCHRAVAGQRGVLRREAVLECPRAPPPPPRRKRAIVFPFEPHA